jgi:hypothetical protein
MHIIFEWDEAKRRATLFTRGLDFAAMERFDWSTAVIREDARRDYGEPRLRAMGLIDGRLHEAGFTPRGNRIRIISLRKANIRERRLWDAR